MSRPRFLTKSRFKLGIECPTKLYYTRKKKYPDTKMDDAFLAALAEGGFQVGELAKLYYPGGHDIKTLDYDQAEQETLELLKQDEVIIYEPAIKFNNLFIRIDILVKKGDYFQLIEVKAKSFDAMEEEPFNNKNGTIAAVWKPYLYDVAFQKHVLQSAYPNAKIESFLMMADKNAKCPVDGLHQKFVICKDENNVKGVKVSCDISDSDLSKKILVLVNVDDQVQQIYEGKDSKEPPEMDFFKNVEFLASHYERDEKILTPIGSKCAGCEFQCSSEDEAKGLKNGFKECWKNELKWKDQDFEDPNILDVWNFRKKDMFFDLGKVKLDLIAQDEVGPSEDKSPGISASQRQWMQIEKCQNNDKSVYFDKEGFEAEYKTWVYPLHFIDFETTAVAIPFNKGRRPYEGYAFQFSHHILHRNGKVEHVGQYLNTEPGIFPNYDFVRALKSELENDQGTIFRYAPHENTYLNLIYRQLMDDDSEIPDREELCEFIQSITTSVKNSPEKWQGERSMVDMWRLVKRYYYDPHTNGSNSIKQVLPAILNSSKYIQDKYSKPIYGKNAEIKSLNFDEAKTWVVQECGEVKDPYKLLPKLFQDVSDKNFEIMSECDELANGGAALTAYAKLQFTEVSDYEKQQLEEGLLKYCELDTLAMVMIFEAWREMCKDEAADSAVA